jgi:hypothetical protein
MSKLLMSFFFLAFQLIQKEKEFVGSEERCKELQQSLANAKKDAESLAKDLEHLRNTQRSCSELQDRYFLLVREIIFFSLPSLKQFMLHSFQFLVFE